jgi:uncharacterized membrane protein YcaP (DUF421 family)
MFDYIVGITIGSLGGDFAIAPEGEVLYVGIAMVIYACVSLFISFITTKSIKLRRILVGKPFTLLKHGQIYEDNFRKTKLDINEFLSSMRNEGYFDISKIELAVLESNGKISFMPKAEYRPLTPNDKKIKPDPEGMVLNLIVDGNIIYKNLDYSGRDMKWLNKELKKAGFTSVENIFLATCDINGALCVYEKNKKPQPIDVWI